jgi:putative (di)nucleoside polyphosphate hydrolase
VDYWHPVKDVVYFKRDVYQQALTELGDFLGLSRPKPESSPTLVELAER